MEPYVSVDRGAEIGMNHSSISEDESEGTHRFALNTDIERHVVDYSGNYIDTNEVDSSDLKNLDIYTETPKILIRYINSNIIAARDNQGYVSTNGVYHIQCEDYIDYLCGCLPSELLSFWYRHSFQSTEVKFPKVQMSHIDALPVVIPHTSRQNETINQRINSDSLPVDKLDDEAVTVVNNASDWEDIRQELTDRVPDIMEVKEKKNGIDLSLTNYIGFSERDTDLGNVGVYISQADEDSLLRNTADEYHDDSLRLGTVFVEKDGSTIGTSQTLLRKLC